MVSGEAYVKQPRPAIRVGTYNIRYSDGDRGTLNSWWCRKGVRVLSCETRSDFRPGTQRYPSDHFPVVVELVP